MSRKVELYYKGHEVDSFNQVAFIDFFGTADVWLPGGRKVTKKGFPDMLVESMQLNDNSEYMTVLKDEYANDPGYRQALAYGARLPDFVLDRVLVRKQYRYHVKTIMKLDEAAVDILNRLARGDKDVFYLRE